MSRIPRDAAIKLLKELEQTRTNMLHTGETSVDYAVRVCQAVVAKAGGFTERSQWDGTREKESRDTKRRSR